VLSPQEREKYVIATKCGIVTDAGGMRFDGSRAHVRAACEASLKRLGTDYINLFYLHSKHSPVSLFVH
jgi:aryl-alcohol dehydrogenase-like predicted oxidoreductase